MRYCQYRGSGSSRNNGQARAIWLYCQESGHNLSECSQWAGRQGSPCIRIAYRSIVLGARRLTACDTLNCITIRVFEVDLSVPKYFAAARGAEEPASITELPPISSP
jgi:hypothetical protein